MEYSSRMRRCRTYRTIWTTLFLLGWVASWPLQTGAQVAEDPLVSAGLDQVLSEEWASQSAYGFVAAVQFGDGSIWSGAAGYNDPNTQEPLSVDLLFGFASITKTYTAAVIMKLVEEGVLTLDDRIGDWITPMTFVNANITIRQLLNHTSGVYNYTNNADLVPAVWADPGRYWTPREILTTFLKSPVFFAGTGAEYSNSNFHLAHLVIEAATGATYTEVLRDRLLTLLDLNETFSPPGDTLNGTLATTWVDISGNGQLEDYRHLLDSPASHTQKGAAGGMIATVSDIVRWGRHLFNGDVLSSASVDSMKSWVNLNGQNATWTGYGLGIMRYRFNDMEVWGHSGLIHGSRSLMVYSPVLDLSVAVVDNSASLSTYQVMGRLLETVSGFSVVSVEKNDLSERPTAIPYPNPSSAAQPVTIPWSPRSSGVAVLEIYDVQGRRVVRSERSVDVLLDEWRLDPGVLPEGSGTYFYRIIQSDGNRVAGSFIRRR